MIILGISCFFHDAAAALVIDGNIIAAAQEERFTRKKHDESFPVNATKYCLEEAGLDINAIDVVAFYDKPLLKFERLLETYNAFTPKGWFSFMKSMPVWIKEKVFLKRMIREGLQKIDESYNHKTPLVFPEHHLSHAASAFYPSPFDEAAIVTIDGVGEWCTTSIAKGRGKDISVVKELHFPHSIGLLYSAFTYFLGFKVNSGEYKLMGLAPYGNSNDPQVGQFKAIIYEKLCTVYEDGSIFLDQSHFTYSTSMRMVDDKKWEKLFGFPRNTEGQPLEQHHCNLAIAIQEVTEEIVLKIAKTAKELTGCNHICLAGGVALNCVANGKLAKAALFDKIYVQPAAGDAGGALGAALATFYIHEEQPRNNKGVDKMKGSYLGVAFDNKAIEKTITKHKAVAEKIEATNELCERVAKYIAEGKVVGWFQNRMEFGPRALGNRSILADPRNAEMQKKLNLKIKFREGFRPFAPIMLQEEAACLFGLKEPSPYMLFVHPILPEFRNSLPEGYKDFSLMDKLYVQRSVLPAITHIDFTARIQTLAQEVNPIMYELLNCYKKETGFGVLINTSFNVRGEPIVCTPEEAYACFMRTDMDMLVCGQYVFYKQLQPDAHDKTKWSRTFADD